MFVVVLATRESYMYSFESDIWMDYAAQTKSVVS